ncbi:MAG: DEAD/DEAH box helicase [Ottowia sp.]
MASFEENTPLALDSQAPEAIETVAPQNPFQALGLAPELLAAVTELGYTEPTAVQQQAIPLALAAHPEGANDLMVSSQTGSGKTAAFLLPVLHTLLAMQRDAEARDKAAWDAQVAEALARGEAPPRKPRRKNPLNPRQFKPAVPGALVLCPTRELAQQVARDAIDLVRHCRGLRIANVVGGMPYGQQIAQLQNAALVVATPGRLLDLHRGGQIVLDQVRFLVVDEADRMLDLGFADALAEIHQLTAQRQQTMMFSATFAAPIQQLAMRVMHDDGARVQKVQVATPQQSHANIRQELYWADSPEHRRRLLDYWLRDPSIGQAIVFACTQIECDQLATDLQQAGFAAVALHGALSQALRNRRLRALREGQVQILVATDVAARGIDVPSITHVINYGLPMKAEDYTHRIGRTGRAGRDGLAVTLAEFRDRRRLADIEAYTRQHFRPLVVAGLEPTKHFPPVTEPRAPRKPAPRDAGAGRGNGPRGASRLPPGSSGRFQPRRPTGGRGQLSKEKRTGATGTPRGGRRPWPRRRCRAPLRTGARWSLSDDGTGRRVVLARLAAGRCRPAGAAAGAGGVLR